MIHMKVGDHYGKCDNNLCSCVQFMLLSEAEPEPTESSDNYRDHIKRVATQDAARLLEKDLQYGGSWKRRGGVGAYMMAARKIDRIEEQMKKSNFDIFEAIKSDNRTEGLIDDIRDLRGYLILIESEMRAQGILNEPTPT